ncbi:hypothetical protein CLV35_2734 [Motilibacter peucedani]|uniref:Short subunit dehydrogenase n=1 Tax=Motilibacter peucedani TaxID=598650 RepID=A0A420XME3_9ACTN|nr:hypothetical protein [Motilibacter peucedani]RKS72490.1 hypothetical protein CLV35_2734 [Motilibacter peucedani]
MPRRILVVGATRVLRPAVLRLADDGWRVVAVARTGDELERLADERRGSIAPLAADRTRTKELRARLTSAGTLDAALVYAPGAPAALLAVLRRAVSGPVVQLLTSAAAAPDGLMPAAPAQPWHQVVLGWRDGRWHTPEEVSAAALTALAEERDVVLGAVRPWAERPQ